MGRRGSKQSENWFCMAPLAYTNWVVLPDKVQPKLFCGCFIYMQIFQLSVTFIVSFLLISNSSYVRILWLLPLTVVLLKMYVEAYKTSSQKLYFFFSLCVYFLMLIIAVCVLLFLIKLRWLKNRSIYDKVGKYQTPKKSLDQNWSPPPPPQILCQYLLRHANLKLIKIKLKLFAANIFINGMFQVLN